MIHILFYAIVVTLVCVSKFKFAVRRKTVRFSWLRNVKLEIEMTKHVEKRTLHNSWNFAVKIKTNTPSY